jgi:hypothetical protein
MNTRSSWIVPLSLVALFLLGAISGAGLMRAFQRLPHLRVAVERDWARSEEQALRKSLKLRPEQVVALQPILAQTASRMRQVKLETVRQIAELIRQNSTQVLPLLDEEQKRDFERLIKERQARVAQSGDGS